MTDYLLMAIIALLALDVLLNLAQWSRQSKLWSGLTYRVRATRKSIRVWAQRTRRKVRDRKWQK